MCRGSSIVALLQIRVDQIFDRVTELIPNKLAFIAGGILQCGIRRSQISANHSIPISQPRVDVRRHVDRMRIVRRDPFVLARDLK